MKTQYFLGMGLASLFVANAYAQQNKPPHVMHVA